MTCAALETRILDYLENQLPAAERKRVHDHLLACANCRNLAEQLRQLDSTLERHLPVPALSPGFVAALRERLRAEAFPSEQERAERKRQLQAEFEAAIAQLGSGCFRWESLLQTVVGPFAIGLGGLLVCQFTPAVRLLPDLPDAASILLLPSLIASAAFLLVGVKAAFPSGFRLLFD
jgi:anti-sigma factor RsiW